MSLAELFVASRALTTAERTELLKAIQYDLERSVPNAGMAETTVEFTLSHNDNFEAAEAMLNALKENVS